MQYDYSKIDKKVDEIVRKVSSYMRCFDKEYIEREVFKAYSYAKEAHEGQKRLSGDPYIIHPVEAAKILLFLKPDLSTIQACILHDVVEDTHRTLKDIENEFGKDIAFLCSGMEKLGKVRYVGEDRNIGSLRKMFVAMAQDLRVIFIKISDRIHNMKTLKFHPKKEKRQRIAMETLNIYAPIADRLGLFYYKNLLEEEAFKILDFKGYKKLKDELNNLSNSKERFEKNARKEIDNILVGQVENYEVDFRVKSIYSIKNKLIKKGLESASELYDLFGIRITVKDISDCYRVLGIIHNEWKPIPNKFKDYIALPKPNGYKSLHTTIIGMLEKQPTEIQIKTYEMKEYSDIGVAAHFDYKEKGSIISNDTKWVKELKELTESLENSDFMNSLKIDVFKNRIFVFTPKGESVNLPVGSTPVDFAYYVHSELGNHIISSKVNGAVYPLDKELHNGDRIEVVTSKDRHPSPYWLSFVKTAKAKNRIKVFLKKENEGLYRDRGKLMMNKLLGTYGIQEFDKELSILKVMDGREYNIEERLQIIEKVGDFSITPASLLKRILKAKNITLHKKGKNIDKNLKKELLNTSERDINIVIGGEEGMKYRLCNNCCKKGVPQKIVGHINNKGIISIHKNNCKILESVNKDRLLPAYIKGESELLQLKIKFLFVNNISIFKDLSDVIYSMEIEVEEITSKKIDIEKIEITISLEIYESDYLMLDRLIKRVKFAFEKKLIDYKIEGLK